MIVPLGAWCRTAYQVSEFVKNKEIQPITYPFDWTITPFSALRQTMDKDFSPEKSLSHENIGLSIFGSILDEYTQLIHHHDLPSTALTHNGDGNGRRGVNKKGIPLQFFETELISKAKGRLLYAFANLERLKLKTTKICFVRWIRSGHPDSGLPYAFEDESVGSLAAVLNDFLGHDSFCILQVTSYLTNKELNESEIISSYVQEKYGVAATIYERKGLDGDGTENFRGDTKAWNYLLRTFIADQGITV